MYTVDKQLKYDFIVHPGGKVADIQLNYSGEESMKLLPDGQLQITGSLGSLVEDAPYMYVQESKQKVSGNYVLNKNEVGFSTDSYHGTLVIDPGVTWATYYGGEGVEELSGVAADVEGNVYVSGTTNSLNNMATSGAHQSVFSGTATDGYLAKFDSTGTLLWATYYGGTASTGFYHVTMGTSVAVNSFNQVYLSGVTSVETGIATTGTYQPTWSSTAFMQGFLAQFNDNGIRQWGTYYSASVANPAFFCQCYLVFWHGCRPIRKCLCRRANRFFIFYIRIVGDL